MKRLLIAPLAIAAAFAGAATAVIQDVCGPFTDVSPALCPYVLEMYYLGITAGTSATTYSPDSVMTRGQAAVFVSKGVNQAIARSSRRAALAQWWTTKDELAIGRTTIEIAPRLPAADGADVWAPHLSGKLTRVRASDGRLLETWTTPNPLNGTLVAMGRVFATGNPFPPTARSGGPAPGTLYVADPSQNPGPMAEASTDLGVNAFGLAFDGQRIWTANYGTLSGTGSISIVTPGPSIPWSVTSVSTGFSQPIGLVFDGTNMWATDATAGTLLKLDSNGNILQSVPVGASPGHPVFDGGNIWVPLLGQQAVAVVSASSGSIVETLTGNGLGFSRQAAFDGQRVLVTGGGVVSVWRAADLLPMGSVSFGGGVEPFGVCSDGINFWITLVNGAVPGELARF